jgi:hypothetical protein
MNTPSLLSLHQTGRCAPFDICLCRTINPHVDDPSYRQANYGINPESTNAVQFHGLDEDTQCIASNLVFRQLSESTSSDRNPDHDKWDKSISSQSSS